MQPAHRRSAGWPHAAHGWAALVLTAGALVVCVLIAGSGTTPAAGGTPAFPGSRDPTLVRGAGETHVFGLRASRQDPGVGAAGPEATRLLDRTFAPVLDTPEFATRPALIGTDQLATPAGMVRLSTLADLAAPFSTALTRSIRADEVAVLPFAGQSRQEILALLAAAQVTVLDVRPVRSFLVTGLTPQAQTALIDAGVRPLSYTCGLFTSPAIGVTPVDTPARAADPNLTLLATLFRVDDAPSITAMIRNLGGAILSTAAPSPMSPGQGRVVTFVMHIDTLRTSLAAGAWDGLPIRNLTEAERFISADEDTSTGVQTGTFAGGARPYTEAGIDGSTQVIGITDTGLSLDATVLADGPAGALGLGTAHAAGPGHRKVIGYTDAGTISAGGAGDLLSCDGTTGATHGHLVASIAAGNASALLAAAGRQACDLPGLETARSGCTTTHALDGVSPGARIAFIDAQEASQCVQPTQIEAQTPGLLSDNSAHHADGPDGTRGTSDDARVHLYAQSILDSQGSYTAAAQDIDAWLVDNQAFLVVTAAGNEGVDPRDDGNLEFGTVTSPGTAKNVVTVGSSGYPNNALDLEASVVPGVANNGIEMISRFAAGSLGSGQGPAAFTTQANTTPDWRLKPDVMAPGDETLGNQRMVSPTTCISDDDGNGLLTAAADDSNATCRPLPPETFVGTSFAAAATAGFAALVRDYFAKGFAPAGQEGGPPQDLSGPELKAALIASATPLAGNPPLQRPRHFSFRGGGLLTGPEFLEFYNPHHLAGYTPEQGYGRISGTHLLPLASNPDTPSFIEASSHALAFTTPVVSMLSLLDPGEPLTVAVAWYDRPASVAGPLADGKLVDDVDLTVRLCGPDDLCDTPDDTLTFGNFFTEDANFDGGLSHIPDVFVCSTDGTTECDPDADICMGGAFDGVRCHGRDEHCQVHCDTRTDLCVGGPDDGTGGSRGTRCHSDFDCTPDNGTCEFDASTQCPGGTTGVDSCDLFFSGGTEDCNGDELLDSSFFSLPVTGHDCLRLPGDDGTRDRNNTTEKVHLSPAQLAGSHTAQITLNWVASATDPLLGQCSNSGAPCDPTATDPGLACGDVAATCVPRTVQAGLVITGAFDPAGAPNRVRLDRSRYRCADALSVDLLDGAADASVDSIASGLTLTSIDCGVDGVCGTPDDVVLDIERPRQVIEIDPATRFAIAPLALVDARGLDPRPDDGLLSVTDHGRIQATYTDLPVTRATAEVRCTPDIQMMNVVRRGTDAAFGLSGGCDPRERVDPRMVLFGLVRGTGLDRTGDLYLDAGEQLVYTVAFASQEEGTDLHDVTATLTACTAGSAGSCRDVPRDGTAQTFCGDGTSCVTDADCDPSACHTQPGVRVLDPVQRLGTISPGRPQSVSFNVQVATGVSFPDQFDMQFRLAAVGSGLTHTSETRFHHLLDADTWSRPDESPAVSGVFHYSTDFPTGGQEIRLYAGELASPADPSLDAELFVFDDATTAAFGLGNAQLGDALGGASVPNNWPWTFDLDDEAFRTRRRFDSDAGLNAELADTSVWQHSTSGECGFQSNAGTCEGGSRPGAPCETAADCHGGACRTAAATDGQGGQGGIWHTGFAASDPDTPPGRTGFDLGCEDYDVPFDPGDHARRFVLDTLSSPRFFRVHANVDAHGFAYTLSFTRLAANLQVSIGDASVIMAGELDPDATTPVPVDPLDMGWLFSDQGPDGFLAMASPGPFLVFNPNNPHEATSAAAAGLPLSDAPGGAQTIRAIHGPGSAGSFFDDAGTCRADAPIAGAPCSLTACGTVFDPLAPGNGQVPAALGGECVNETDCGPAGICEANEPFKAPSRPFGEVTGVATGRGLASPSRRGAGGLPVRNLDLDLASAGAATFEDLFGPHETRGPDAASPITSRQPEVLAARRDAFQVNFIAWLRGDIKGNFHALPDYGLGVDDVVVEWREGHPVADRTPCADPSTWAVDEAGHPVGSVTDRPELAAGCAQISWDRHDIVEVESMLALTVIDINAAYGADGIVGTGDDQAIDTDGDGLAELDVRVFSDVDLAGETVHLIETGFASPVYRGSVVVSTTHGLSSDRDGVIFMQAAGGGAVPVVVTASYTDADINVAGAGAAVPCPDNPLLAQAVSRQNTADVLFATARVSDEGPGTDGDDIPDDGEQVRLDVALINNTRDILGDPVDLDDVTVTLTSTDSDVACILEESSHYGRLAFGKARFNNRDDFRCEGGTRAGVACDTPDDAACEAGGGQCVRQTDEPFRFVVATPGRTDVKQVIQAEFILGIAATATDSLGRRRSIASFATPQRLSINLDLDITGAGRADVSDRACVGGDRSGFACGGEGICSGGSVAGVPCDPTDPTPCTAGGGTCADACPGLQGDGSTPATCTLLPPRYRAGGSAFVAGEVGYFEGFEGAVNMAGRNFAGADPIPGTGFSHRPALNTGGGFLERAVRDWLEGGRGVLEGLSPGSVPGNTPDDPEGSSAVDGIRCSYNDPRGATPHPRSETGCRPWDGSDWHVNDNLAFHGARSLYGGINGDEDLGADISFDTNHTNLLAAAFTPPLSVGVGGGSTLSIYHIIQMADDRTFSVPDDNAVGRGFLEAAPIDPDTGLPDEGGWFKLSGFQNNYDSIGTSPFFLNCIFDPYDDFYDAAAAHGNTPGFRPDAVNQVNVRYNADNISSEDDYFDPNDPLRELGPSGGCFPAFVYSAIGDYTATDLADIHPILRRGFTGGEPGETGAGIWVNSLFSLDRFAGKTIRLRFVQTDIDIGVGFTWADLFGNGLGNATRGWRIDDVAVSGLLDAPAHLIPDRRTPPASACDGPACSQVTADAGEDLFPAVAGSLVELSAGRSAADRCVDGVLLYRWRIGGVTVRDFTTSPRLVDNPSMTTLYTVDVACSTDRTCAGSDTVLVAPADQMEIAAAGETALSVEFTPDADATMRPVRLQAVSPDGPDVAGIVVRLDLERGPFHLAQVLAGPGPTPGAASMARLLKQHACGLSLAAPNPATGPVDLEHTDRLTRLATGDTIGYLLYPVAGTGLGSWGTARVPGQAPTASRGSLDPTALGFPAPATFAQLSTLPAGTPGNCTE
ncbi:MAG: S8 family serine peptidase [Acidobacteriota bacterium]